jgi:hypothetical protein
MAKKGQHEAYNKQDELFAIRRKIKKKLLTNKHLNKNIENLIFFLSHRFVPFPLCQHCYHVDKGDHHVDYVNPRVASEWLRLHLSKVCNSYVICI